MKTQTLFMLLTLCMLFACEGVEPTETNPETLQFDIAYLTDEDLPGGTELYRIRPDGTDQRRLTSNEEVPMIDSQYPMRLQINLGKLFFSAYYHVGCTTGHQKNVRPCSSNESPKATGRDVFQVDLQGNDIANLTGGMENVQDTTADFHWFYEPAPSPVSDEIIYTTNLLDGSEDIFMLDGQESSIPLTNTIFNSTRESAPVWSPSGNEILLEYSNNDFQRKKTLALMRPDGSGLRRLTSMQAYWFGNTKMSYRNIIATNYLIILASGDRYTLPGFMDRLGNTYELFQKEDFDYIHFLDWHPDGRRALLTQVEAGSGQENLILYDPVSREMEIVRERTSTGESNRIRTGAYSPDGNSILLTVGGRKYGDLFVIEGEEANQVTFSGAILGTPVWIPRN